MLHSKVVSSFTFGSGGHSMVPPTRAGEWPAFRFEDASGGFVGEATSEPTLPARYILLDEHRWPVLSLDSVGPGGPILAMRGHRFLIHDASAAVLAALEMQPGSWGRERGVTVSSWGRQYGVTIDGRDAMLLVANPTGSLFQLIELGSGTVLASGATKWAPTTSRTQIDIPEWSRADHRIALGAFLMLSYTSGG